MKILVGLDWRVVLNFYIVIVEYLFCVKYCEDTKVKEIGFWFGDNFSFNKCVFDDIDL